MEISEIISITGQGGLFKVIARTKTGLIVESLKDNKRQPVYASQKISALEDISIFGQSEDVPLNKIFRNIFDKEKGGKAIDPKSDNNALKKYFVEVFPDFDEARVYVSDIKKVYTWYNTLHELGMLKVIEEKKESVATSTEEGKKSEEKEAKPKAKKATTVKPVAKVKETAAPKASSKAKGGKTSTIRKTGA